MIKLGSWHSVSSLFKRAHSFRGWDTYKYLSSTEAIGIPFLGLDGDGDGPESPSDYPVFHSISFQLPAISRPWSADLWKYAQSALTRDTTMTCDQLDNASHAIAACNLRECFLFFLYVKYNFVCLFVQDTLWIKKSIWYFAEGFSAFIKIPCFSPLN